MATMARTLTVAGSVCPLASAGAPSTSTQVAFFAPLALKKSFRGVQSLTHSSRSATIVRATSSSEDVAADPSVQFNEVVDDLKKKWEQVEDKQTVALYAGGALVGLWVSSTLVGAVNAVPVLPKFLELIGLGYTSWFVYRYLLFKSSREELVKDLDELKGKITGAAGSVTGKDDTTV